jgi:hypothetical protein
MTGNRLAGAALIALALASGCGDASSVDPVRPLQDGRNVSASFSKAGGPTVFEGEKIFSNSVINVLYDWDVGAAGPLVFASRPMGPDRWPEHNNANATNFIYVVVYPVGSTVTGLMCYDTPNETCPDHGPVVAAGAKDAYPAVYGGGVLGHDHMQPKIAGAHAWVKFVLFTNAAAANTHITSRAEVEAAVSSGNAFVVPEPALTFHNAPVSGRIYDMATAWVCPAYMTCDP